MGNGDAEDIAAQVIEHLLATAGVLSVHDPFLTPGFGGDLEQEPSGFEAVAHLGSKHLG